MSTGGIVVAVSETLAVRETLAILLEQECDLRFAAPASVPSPTLAAADVALVALVDPRPTLTALQQEWPHVPVVAVEVPGRRTATAPLAIPAAAAEGTVCRVPLEPHAIRRAVLDRLSPAPESDLSGPIGLVVETLRAELGYALRALRTFSTLHARSPGPDTHALLGAVMREQSHVLAECLEQMERFCARPRHSARGADFLAAVRAAVDRDESPGGRRVVCRWRSTASYAPPGPTALAPLVAGYVLDHLRRNSAAAVVDGHESGAGLTVVYPPQRGTAEARLPWALALADFALRPWGWRVALGGAATGVTLTVGLAAA